MEVLEKYQRILNLPLEDSEEWRVIKDFPNYIITNHGRVFNTKTGKELHPSKRIHETKYKYVTYRVTLFEGKKRKQCDVHRLVATYFIPFTGFNPDGTQLIGKPQINHKDANTANNHYTNLEYCDAQYNNSVKSSTKYANKSEEELEQLLKQYTYNDVEYHSIRCALRRKRRLRRYRFYRLYGETSAQAAKRAACKKNIV